jgi:hypothetical protein
MGCAWEAIAADIAGDGDTALELLSVNAYDIAVLDRDIPGPSGDEIPSGSRRCRSTRSPATANARRRGSSSTTLPARHVDGTDTFVFTTAAINPGTRSSSRAGSGKLVLRRAAP